MRECKVDLRDILDIVMCADTYGHYNSVLLHALWEWAGSAVSDEEIQELADSYLTDEARSQGYTEEDAEQARLKVAAWRARYVP